CSLYIDAVRSAICSLSLHDALPIFHVARHRRDQAGPTLGPHRAGIDRAEADVVLAVLAGERHREVLPRGVGGARRNLPIGCLHAVVADQIDHAPAALLDHDRQHVAQAAHVAHEFELQRLFPVGLGQMLEHAAGRGAGIVDHDVDAAERLVGLGDEILGIGVFAEIGGDRHDPAVGFPRDLGRCLLERLLAPRADGNIDAFLRQRAGDAFADTGAAARDQRGLAVKLEVHVGLLVRSAPEGSAQADLCASQRPASAAEKSSASAAFTTAGSSLLMVWPARGTTRSAAVGAVRLMNTLPSRQRSSSSPTMTRSGTENCLSSPSISHRVGRLSWRLSMVWAWPSGECSDSMRANSLQPRGSLFLNACRMGASAYLA